MPAGTPRPPAVWGAPAAKAGMPRWAPILPATRKPVTAAAAATASTASLPAVPAERAEPGAPVAAAGC
ncbi:Uncharacterised protein [Mycobacterium tuberculosis]|uniref:Uncharacterized protein n=1 Tax=Mycobacterium tuberculosis TaxID=1773 RepID=A0A655ASW5_MYCTX|nr:Uncharacterised protein [Mycobacterium tuberculosis]